MIINFMCYAKCIDFIDRLVYFVNNYNKNILGGIYDESSH